MSTLIKKQVERGVKKDGQYLVSEEGFPNYYRDLFPYTEPPKVAFDDEVVPLEPAPEFWITDTTFRDGQQAMEPYTVNQVVDIYKMLHQLGGPKGLIRQCEFFLYMNKDREAVEKCRALEYQYPEVTAWIRATAQDFQLVKDMGLKETGILTSMSDYHIFKKLGLSKREDAINNYMKIVENAAKAGFKAVRCHFEDMTRADFWRACVPFSQRLMQFSKDSGMKIKIRVCDTMGYAVPWPQATLPRSVPKIVYHLRHDAGVPSDCLEMHMHNDFHGVVINSVTGWLYGASAINGCLFMLGERTGNCPIEALIFWYIGLTGDSAGIDTTVITEIKDYYVKNNIMKMPIRHPFTGENFNVTMAGIHADGMIKDEEIYNIFDTTKLLKRQPGVGITDKTGIAGVAMWIETKIGKDLIGAVDKRDPRIAEIQKKITAQYEAGRVSSMSNEEMARLIKEYFPEWWTDPVKKRLIEKGVNISI